MKVATGLARGIVATPDLAAEAVHMAMQASASAIARGILLFLTADFATRAQAAVTAAARAGNCLQVAGCTAMGLFTEAEWVLDVPAAAALVLGDGGDLHDSSPATPDWRLALAAPNALDGNWLNAPGRRFGGVSGDATGQGIYSVWKAGRLAPGRRCEVAVRGGHFAVDVSRGLQPLSAPEEITGVAGHDILAVAGQPALTSLSRGLPIDTGNTRRLPLHRVMAGITYGNPENAVSEGRYHLVPILSANTDNRSVTVSSRPRTHDRLFWAIRQPIAAERDMRLTLERMASADSGTPDFALCFPCLGRGPAFYGGVDRDLELIAERYPGLPVIGFYGSGEIAHLDGRNRLLQYSTVLALHYPEPE